MLLVREVVGPARSQIGTIVLYRATAFNTPDPVADDLAEINWVVRAGNETIQEFLRGGGSLEYKVPDSLAGKTIRVMPYRNSPTENVSVLTKIDDDGTVGRDPDSGLRRAGPHLVAIDQQGSRYFATLDAGPRFFIGGSVRYLGNRVEGGDARRIHMALGTREVKSRNWVKSGRRASSGRVLGPRTQKPVSAAAGDA